MPLEDSYPLEHLGKRSTPCYLEEHPSQKRKTQDATLDGDYVFAADENQQAFKDPLHVPVGPITKARSKKIKEALNGLIQEIWADSNAGHSKLGPKEDEGVINLIQAIES